MTVTKEKLTEEYKNVTNLFYSLCRRLDILNRKDIMCSKERIWYEKMKLKKIKKSEKEMDRQIKLREYNKLKEELGL